MIIAVTGNLSAGKTVTCIKLIKEEFDKDKSIHIISNMKINIKGLNFDYLNLDELFQMSNTNPEFFKNSILFIDEVHNLIDARRSSSNLNQKFTQFATQLGKLDCNLMITAQMFESQIDLRLRELCDILMFCVKVDDKGFPILTSKRKVDQEIFIQVKGYVRLFGGMQMQEFGFIYNPKQYYSLYDTQEIILMDRSKYLSKSNYVS